MERLKMEKFINYLEKENKGLTEKVEELEMTIRRLELEKQEAESQLNTAMWLAITALGVLTFAALKYFNVI